MAQITVGLYAAQTQFLLESISSVLAQTFSDLELIVVDGSADGSVSKLAARIRDPRLRVIQGENTYAGAAARVWNEGGGAFFAMLNDGDAFEPEFIEELAGHLQRDARYVFAFSRYAIIDALGRAIERPLLFPNDGWLWFDQKQITEHFSRVAKNPLVRVSNCLIRRAAFAQAGFLSGFRGLRFPTDPGLALLLASAEVGPTVATSKFLARLRQPTAETQGGSSLSIIERDIALRSAVQCGFAKTNTALLGAAQLQSEYRWASRRFPEAHVMLRQAPALTSALAAGAKEVLTDEFLKEVRQAEVLISVRQGSTQGDGQSADVQATSTNRILGEVNKLTRREVHGWAWVPEEPERTVMVEAVLNDEVIGHGEANYPRADLQRRNIGTGRYGFVVNFYRPLAGDERPKLRLFLDTPEWLETDLQLPPLESMPAVTGEGGAAVLREHARFTAAGAEFEEFDLSLGQKRASLSPNADPLIIAFYLSQYHAIPENDQFWGPGFTEWRQLARGAPRFPGHYQPRIPRDLGFYNLLDLDVMRRQADMAKAGGIGAFAFYYYWFNRKRVLEKPIEQFLGSDIDMPFLLIWANENWTRTWDGGAHDVLLEQEYRDEDEDALLADLARHMLDERYVRLDGRPLFVIYNPGPIPNTTETIGRWRQKWRDQFGLNPLIYLSQTFGRDDPRGYGLDGALEFPPHKIGSRAPRRDVLDAFSRDFSGQVIAYDDFVKSSLEEPQPPFPIIKTALPSWDNEARRPNRGLMLEGSSPAKYQAWLKALIDRAIETPVQGRPVVAINAWNEWAEGAYLEPDVHFGSAYLNATGRALQGALTTAAAAKAKPQATMQKFIVIGAPRTGSTLIQTTLDQHPDIRAYGELFHWVASEREGDHAMITPSGRRAYQPDAEDALDFLWANVWNAEVSSARAVGFKLFNEHVATEGTRDLFARLKSDVPDLKVVYVWRDNLMDVLVSRRMAESTGEWVRRVGASAVPDERRQITILPDEAEDFFRAHEQTKAFFDSYVADMSAIRVRYSDFAASFESQSKALYEFLGVSPRPVTPAIRKQLARSSREIVANWDDLAAHFQGSSYARFFEADPLP
ncbi:glycoside hydrolase family 99-like domain-containing protein [Phenylobacterium deserti]|uniref:Glycosyltransferase 2-like domain-containing protein n=1 Tax=Phenylobacterium deserti TaxID=1914756 RepID=A0A328ATY3_9CAUL|nr:glycoside hydrolase family 99-like domain-containing protein [Phenylobacterium deserti]RAK57146.1 hypothetical protein DJ018_04100 [Phenylobacterium deserti]